jgi:hypothetical protein
MRELIAIYKREKSIRDVFVEGPSDRALIAWYLQQSGVRHASVLGVDSIELSANLEPHFPVGCKGRVIALAFKIRELLPGSSSPATCVADKDLDDLLGVRWQCDLLFFTDFTAMEMYFFDEESLGKFFDLQLLGFPESPATVIERLSELLGQLFLYRAANEKLKWNMTRPDWRRCAEVRSGRIVFNSEEFVRRYLNANRRAGQAEAFRVTLEDLATKLASDPRRKSHGHDLIEVLTWYCHKLRRATTFDEEHFHRGLMATADAGTLRGFPLFEVLLGRVRIGESQSAASQ